MAKKSNTDDRVKVVAEFSIYNNDVVEEMFTKALSFANIVASLAEDLIVNASKSKQLKYFDGAQELLDALSFANVEDSKVNNGIVTLAVWMLATSLVLSREEAEGSDITRSTSIRIIKPTEQ